MKKQRKKKWTTKNTHFKRMKKKVRYVDELEKSILWKIFMVIGIIIAFLSILVIALDNHVVGYDHFIGIPHEWVRSLYDR